MKIKTSNLLGLIMILASTTVWSGSDKPKGKEEIISIEQAPDNLKEKLKTIFKSLKEMKYFSGKGRDMKVDPGSSYLLKSESRDGKTLYLVADDLGYKLIDDEEKEYPEIHDLLKHFSISEIKTLFERNGIPNKLMSFINIERIPMYSIIVSSDKFDPTIFSREVLDFIGPKKLLARAELMLEKMTQALKNAYKRLGTSDSFKESLDTMSKILKKEKSFEINPNTIINWTISRFTESLTEDKDSETFGVNSLKKATPDLLEQIKEELIQIAQQSINARTNLLTLSKSRGLSKEQREYFKALADKMELNIS